MRDQRRHRRRFQRAAAVRHEHHTDERQSHHDSLHQPDRANDQRAHAVDLAVADGNLGRPQHEGADRDASQQVTDAVPLDVRQPDTPVFIVGGDAHDGAFAGIGGCVPDAPDVAPLMHVGQHRIGRGIPHRD
jgi:hypothetical protein